VSVTKPAVTTAIAVLAAALVGLGLVMWVAANWNDFGRMGRFGLLQATVLAMCIGAALSERARSPLGLLALIAIGGLFAYFGQTYQTGADPWQLFALWAVLALPLCIGARSDVLWAPWALVAAVAISLWLHAHTGHMWRAEPSDWPAYLAAWLACAALVLALGPLAQPWTGAGSWSMRTAGTLAVGMVTVSGILALLHDSVAPQYGVALLLFAGGALALAATRLFDVFVLSAVMLGLDTLLVGGMARGLFLRGGTGDPIGKLFIIGLAAAGLLALSVTLVMRVSARRRDGTG
jgi:uncharacterized membrane protein